MLARICKTCAPSSPLHFSVSACVWHWWLNRYGILPLDWWILDWLSAARHNLPDNPVVLKIIMQSLQLRPFLFRCRGLIFLRVSSASPCQRVHLAFSMDSQQASPSSLRFWNFLAMWNQSKIGSMVWQSGSGQKWQTSSYAHHLLKQSHVCWLSPCLVLHGAGTSWWFSGRHQCRNHTTFSVIWWWCWSTNSRQLGR